MHFKKALIINERRTKGRGHYMINETAKIENDCIIGEHCVIEKDVIIGTGCTIGHHTVIRKGTMIGNNVRIDDFACIGKLPMKAANSAVTSDNLQKPAIIGDGTMIGVGAIIYRGAVIGNDCLIADNACVREEVAIGDKTIIGRSATIENKTTVGKRVKIQTNAYITAFSEIEDDCFIAPCVVTSNDNYAGRSKERFNKFKGLILKKGGRIGAGAVILPGKIINEDGFVAAGSVVTKDVECQTVVVGVPAEKKYEVKDDQLLTNQ